jgi:hypothetical protein
MDSRRKTGGDCGRLPAVTRRSLVGATFVPSGLGRGLAGRPDDVLVQSRAWLAVNAAVDRLTLAWQDEEGRLARDFDWLKLSTMAQRNHPEGRQIHALGERIAVLTARRWELLETLEATPAVDLHGVAGKLAVAVSAMRHEDAIGFELLAEAVRELAGQRCRACGATLILPNCLT